MENNNTANAYDLLDSKSANELNAEEALFVSENFDKGVTSFEVMRASAAFAKKALQSESYQFEPDLNALENIKRIAGAANSANKAHAYLNSPVFWSIAASIILCLSFSFYLSPKGANFIKQNVSNLRGDTALLHIRFEAAYINRTEAPTPAVETEYKSVKLKRMQNNAIAPAKRINSKTKEGEEAPDVRTNADGKAMYDSLAIQAQFSECSLV